MEEVGPLGVPLDSVEIEQVVIGLSAFSGIRVVGGALGAGVLCYWRCRIRPIEGMAQDGGLGDEKLRSEPELTTSCASGGEVPSWFREKKANTREHIWRQISTLGTPYSDRTAF